MSDNELDNLFKEAADGFKPPQDSSAWQDMSRKLDEVGATTTAFWNWKTVSSLAVLGVTGVAVVWYLSQQNIDQQPTQDQAVTLTPESKSQVVPALAQSPMPNPSSVDQQVKVKEEEQALRAQTQASQQEEIQAKANSDSKSSAEIGVKNPGEEKQVKEIAKQKSVPVKERNSSIGKPAAVGSLSVEKTSTQGAAQNADAALANDSRKADSEQRSGAVGTPAIAGSLGVEKTSAQGTAQNADAALVNDSRKADLEQRSDAIGTPATAGSLGVTITATQAAQQNPGSALTTDKKTDSEIRNATAENTTSENSSSASQRAAGDGLTSMKQDAPVAEDSVKEETAQEKVIVQTKSEEKKEGPKEEHESVGRVFSLKLVTGADFASINYYTPDEAGFNYGLNIGYSFNNRWSVYTGAISSRKIYASTEIDKSYTNSGGYPYEIEELEGDCRVLDIPINVYYTFFPQRSFSVKAGVGFSSYLMLSEDYVYYVDNPYGSDVYDQNIDHENNEWFKMLNVSVTIQKKLNDRFYLEFEPYLKAPLAGVGEGEVSLVSLGAFFNLRFDIPIKRVKHGE